jgi:protein AATF/BFR2
VEESDELESGDEGAAVSDEEGSDLEGSAGSDDQSDGSEDVEDSEDEITSDDEESSAPRKPSASKKQSGSKETSADDREELRRLMATDQKTIAATISQASKADAAKGKAVKEQRATFDALLNTRIKLQKGLTAINDITGTAAEDEDAQEEDASNSEAIKSAESAALALWSTLEELRTALAEAQSKDETKKRKRSSVTPSTTSASLWERMADLESESLSHRRSVLDKWSSKVRGAPSSLPNARGKLLGSASGQQTITAVLDAHVATEIGDRSSKRARHATETTEPIYDDTIFYQSLLRELVEQRMSSSEAMSGGLDSLTQLPSRLPIHPVTGMRNDKVKRDIDTRASKGRKMKYNVHEKLQNFMAPEDRGGWTIRARDEFFASLLGRTASGLLGEGDDSGSDAESDDDREEGGLQLFRS